MIHIVRTLSLPASLDISAVAALAVAIADEIASGEIAFDAGAVARIDAAGLQLLFAAVATARARGASVRWIGVSPTLAEGARTLALAAALDLPALPHVEK